MSLSSVILFVEFEDANQLQPKAAVAHSSSALRVRFVVAQTRRSPGWCKMVASAILSNVSVATVGYGKKYSHMRRLFWVMEYIEEEGLQDRDIIVSYDGSDTLLTGALTVQRALKKFIATTAPTVDAFDAEAVRRGDATAPLLFTAEGNCYHPQLSENVKWGVSKGRCISLYKRAEMNALGQKGAEAGGRRKRLHFLNAGGYVARVWALKRAFTAYRSLMGLKRWWCDQSAWGMLYLWSITQNSSSANEARIPYGIVSLDFQNTFFLSVHGMRLGKDIMLWSSTSVAEIVEGGRLPFPLFFNIDGIPDATPAILHMNGVGRKDRVVLEENLRGHTSWFVEANRTPEALHAAKDLLQNGALLDLHGVSGETKRIPFGDVCRGIDLI
ncbi:expression site-associated gene (ESAG-like) protein [Trypanosoma grayi]|uniref:expression site-associated gene (ESAG-like) protein n=1 Tax=Trypanosoma grayi TaxID=71804 RepID=UPI0004F4B6C8|nr:expression site-associated gene (ESAG-like) protein [Trypanosoma grayi]KEG15048.1 expression site-associated gene (ESAG-like) protein [Trypanosoma grayi]